MKNILNHLFGTLCGLSILCTLSVSCTPEDYDGPNGNLPVASDYENNISVTVDQETNYAYFHFEAAKGVTPVWIVDGSSYSCDFTLKKYYRKAGTYTVDCKVKNANGISDGAITKSFTVDHTIMNGFGGFDAQSDKNLFKTASVRQASGYYAPGWVQIADPEVKLSGNDFTVILPEATTDQWQAQVPFETDITTIESEDTYDFSVILTSTLDHPGVTIKLTSPYDDNYFYFVERVTLNAGEPYCFYMTRMPSKDIENLKLFFDFGGNEAGTEVIVENLTFIKTVDNDIVAPEKTEPEPVWVALDSENNLWNQANPVIGKWYYAPNWSPIDSPVVKQDGRSYSFTLSAATFDHWQAQFPIETTLGINDSDEYDFLAIIESSQEFTALVKLTDAGNDDNFFFASDAKLYAGSEVRFFARQVILPSPSEQLKLIFDFGGNPAGTDITIKDIILQKHRE